MKTLALLLLAASLDAQVDESINRMQASRRDVTAFLERSANEITRRAAAEIASKEAWEKVAPQRREEMRRMLGLLPWPARTPLKPRVTSKLDRGTFMVENIAFESMPNIYVTANLYLPKNRQGRVPAIVYVCGHAYTPAGAKTAYQRHGISLAKNGYAAIILDPIQIAETYGVHHGVQSQEMYDWYSRGYTPAGIEVWNAIRAIDYLETRPEIDAAKIGMTGRSGGAAMTWFTAAVDQRVKAAMPVMGISTYAANVAENTQRLHCDCMFPINGYLHDMLHQPALIAPRPLTMAHGRLDNLFPEAGFTEVEQRMKRLYDSYGRADAFSNIVVETGHKDSDFLREASIRFFDKYLLGTSERKLDMEYENMPEKDLMVFPNGAPADAQNYRLHEVFLKPAPFGQFRARSDWEKHRSAVLQSLRKEVFPTLSRDGVRPVVARGSTIKEIGYEELEIQADPGVPVRVLVSRPGGEAPAPVLIYVASDGDDVRAAAAMLNPLRRNEAVKMIVYPRGVGEIPWDKTTWKGIQRNAMHVGETIDSMRLRDVMAAVAAVRKEAGVDARRITLMGKGVSGALALYAAILDPEVEQVTLLDPPTTHTQGAFFLNVLRHVDMPEAVALMAPRRVNFYSSMPAPFEQARQVFSLYGASDRLWVTTTLAGPVLQRYHHGFSSGY